MIKAIIDFSGYPGAELLPVATTIQEALATKALLFPALPVLPPALETLIATFSSALAAKNSKATADFIAFEAARLALEHALGDDGAYVNIVANGSATVVTESGYPSYETSATPDYNPPGAPTDVVLRHGMLSGSFVARYRVVRRRSLTEAQSCIGDPNVEANWKSAGLFSGGKAALSGFEPGTAVWARFRTAGLNGVMGAWSAPTKIMVI